jgi:hypothetical protein
MTNVLGCVLMDQILVNRSEIEFFFPVYLLQKKLNKLKKLFHSISKRKDLKNFEAVEVRCYENVLHLFFNKIFVLGIASSVLYREHFDV